MKQSILIILLILSSMLYAQEHLTLYYFGATSCGWCNTPDCISSINKMHKEFKEIHKEYNVKFVMVCMDSDIKEGLKFIDKYGYWDEISIGSFYYNELVMNYLDKTKIPGVPHIIVFKDQYENESTPIIKKRITIKDIVGEKEIKGWVDNRCPLE
jgi:thiol-disulfide isomerase/thioredoxin